MKLLKWVLFSILLTISFVFIFSDISLQWILFHWIMSLLFFFPYYFWVESIKKWIIVTFLVFGIVLVGLVVIKKLPQKNFSLSGTSLVSIEPEVKEFFFEWGKSNYHYVFQENKIMIEKESPHKEHTVFSSSYWKKYKKYIEKLMNHIFSYSFSKDSIFLVFWILCVLLLSFIFSHSKSLTVSYANIVVIMPFAFFMGNYFFFKPFEWVLLYGQVIFIGILVIISIYKLKN